MQADKPILLIESNNLDVVTIKQALKTVTSEHTVRHCATPLEAWDYLHDEDRPMPCLILVNPCLFGTMDFEYLQNIKQDEILCTIPMVVLADAKTDELLEKCYSIGVAGFIVKSVEYDDLKHSLGVIIQYWTLCRLSFAAESMM